MKYTKALAFGARLKTVSDFVMGQSQNIGNLMKLPVIGIWKGKGALLRGLLGRAT